MQRTAEDQFQAAIRVTGAKNKGSALVFSCVLPGHGPDRNPSASLARGATQPFVVNCHKPGCDQDALFKQVARMIDDELNGHAPPRKRTNGKSKSAAPFTVIAEYGYTDAVGELRYVAVRGDQDGDKTFRQKRPKAGGGYEWKGPAKKNRVPFNLVAVAEGIAEGKPIAFVEGEKDVVSLAKIGVTATCNIGGAGKWGKEETAYLADADLVMLADNDIPGQKHRAAAAQLLADTARRIRFVDLPGLPPGGDVSDWIQAGGDTVELWALIEKAREWKPGPSPPPSGIANTPIVQEAMRRRDPHAHWVNQPCPGPIQTSALLDEIKKCLENYVVLPDHASTFLALWVLHTWVYDAANVSPFALIVSPTKQCGKTTLLVVLKWITSRSSTCSNITAACLFRYVEMHAPTMIIDEADSFVKGDEAMRNILNSGHTRETAFAWRNVEVKGEHIPTPFSTWAPKAIACIGTLAGTLMDRGIRISLRRKKRGEQTARRPMRDRKEFQALRSKLQRWADDHFKGLDNYTPDIPEDLYNRISDNWEFLLAIAELGGQKWWDAAIAAAKAAEEAADSGDINVDLLADIHTLMKRLKSDDFISSRVLAEKLAAMDDKPWGAYGRLERPITTQTVARMLGKFLIKSLHKEHGNGYERRQFEDAWERLLGLK
jgi:putative DNA primase/helicase